jgi:hypothetical protein
MIEVFGHNGFVVEPVIAAMFVTVWRNALELRQDANRGAEAAAAPSITPAPSPKRRHDRH